MVSFNFAHTKPTLPLTTTTLKNWIDHIIRAENKTPGELVYVFTDDKNLLSINKQFLQHDTYTDIVTFPTTDKENIISGEIYISTERVAENARQRKLPPKRELARVMAHGVLHLVGYNDHSASEIKLMRQKEDFYLALHSF